MPNTICPVCKKEKYITPGCDKCLDCAKDAVRKLFAEDPEFGNAVREVAREIRRDARRVLNDIQRHGTE